MALLLLFPRLLRLSYDVPALATGTGVTREETTAAVVGVAVSRVQTCLLARKPGFGTFELWAFGAVPEALIELLLLLVAW